MPAPSNNNQPQPEENRRQEFLNKQDKVVNGVFAVTRLHFITLESGGVYRPGDSTDWGMMVDALYAPQDRFSRN